MLAAGHVFEAVQTQLLRSEQLPVRGHWPLLRCAVTLEEGGVPGPLGPPGHIRRGRHRGQTASGHPFLAKS